MTFLLYLCFFLSGAAALIYEVAWQRMLTLVFGVSTISVAAVLSAFLAGMAVGARLAGPLADRTRRPIRVYALVEVLIAVGGLATLFIIPPLMQAFVLLYDQLQPSWFVSNLIRFALAFAALGLPSVLIGATVPLMTRLIAERTRSTALGFGSAYAFNVAGSVVGAAAAGFFLIRVIGTQNALFCAVAINLLVCLIALLLSTRDRPHTALEGVSRQPEREPDQQPTTAIVAPWFALGVAALSGFLALGYQVAWIRLLAIFTLNSVYVFSMVVSVFLLALAIGAAFVTLLLRSRRIDELSVLSLSQLLLALTAPLLLLLGPSAAALQITRGDYSEATIFGLELALVAAMVFIPTLLIGVSLPLLVSAASRSLVNAGRLVGRIYAWNAFGTITGAALTGVLIVPTFGIRGCLLLLAAGNLVIVAAAALVSARQSAWTRSAPALGAAVFALLVAFLPEQTRFHLPSGESDERVIHYAEGPSATIVVSEFGHGDDTHRALFVDSKSVAGTYPEIVTDQKMLAHIPLLLHPDPQRALTVGFGTGGTSFSMLQYRGVHVHTVEIEPRVAEAFHFFPEQNQGVVGPERDRLNYKLIIDDARAWLHVAPEPYDVIVTDLTSIQYRGNGNLYTAECFELMQRRLTPTGIGAAWVPISGITPEALKLLTRTFQSVFPHTSVWYMINLPTDFVILVGTPAPLEIPLGTIAERITPTLVQRDLAAIGMDNPYKLAACLLLAEDDVRDYTGDGPLHTDDHPILDYLVHASPYRQTLPENLRELMSHRTDATPFITNWPDGAQAPPQAWRNWWAASTELIAGHIAVHEAGEAANREEERAYRAALELVPSDATTRELVSTYDLP